MEIQKAKELRDNLQEDILSLIQKFEEDTKTNVYYVNLNLNLNSVRMLENPLPTTVKVEVEFRF